MNDLLSLKNCWLICNHYGW